MELQVTLSVKDKPIHRHGATYSALPDYSGPTINSAVSIAGVHGTVSQPLATPLLPCSLEDHLFTHSFLALPRCPTPILGRDILTRLKTQILIPSPRHLQGIFLL